MDKKELQELLEVFQRTSVNRADKVARVGELQAMIAYDDKVLDSIRQTLWQELGEKGPNGSPEGEPPVADLEKAEKKEFCRQCRWWIKTIDGMGFCKLYSILCSGEDEACNVFDRDEEE